MTTDTFTPESTTTTNPVTAPAPGAPATAAPATAAPAYATSFPQQVKTNVLGIITLVLGVLGFGIVPVITGHIALSQIKRSGEDGRGLTIAGLILGYVTLAGWLLVAIFWIGALGLAVIGSAVGTN